MVSPFGWAVNLSPRDSSPVPRRSAFTVDSLGGAAQLLSLVHDTTPMPTATSKVTDLDTATITFTANGDWNLNQLKVFVDSFYVIYGIFLFQKLRRESFLIDADQLSGAALGGLNEINLWLDTPFKMRQKANSARPTDFHAESENAEMWIRINNDLTAVGGKLQYSVKDIRPRISSININSPGNISLIGLGDVLKQIRELIKDIYYRNKHEKYIAGLQIKHEELKLINELLEIERKVLWPNHERRKAIILAVAARRIVCLDKEMDVLKLPPTVE
jgi:hypothetical protein